MKSIYGDYEEVEENNVYLCPICGHEIENLELGNWDPCEHVVGCFVSEAGWEVLDDDLRDKFDSDTEAMEDDEMEEPEFDPDDIEEWGKAHIDADMCVTLSDAGIGVGMTSYYFFKNEVE